MLDVRRRALLAAAAAGVVGLPYMMSSTGLMGWLSEGGSSEQIASPLDEAAPWRPTSAASPKGGVAPPREGFPVAHLGELLHFGISKDWITTRWPTVYTLTNQTDLAGYRVPVVTGAAEHDLAGSLTYYFDRDHVLKKIEFHGTTGDPRPIVQLVTSQHGLARQESESADRQVYQRMWSGKPVSELRVETAAVLDAAAPHRRYHVHLLLARPSERGWFAPAQPTTSHGRL
jgi:hypothetical protein